MNLLCYVSLNNEDEPYFLSEEDPTKEQVEAKVQAFRAFVDACGFDFHSINNGVENWYWSNEGREPSFAGDRLIESDRDRDGNAIEWAEVWDRVWSTWNGQMNRKKFPALVAQVRKELGMEEEDEETTMNPVLFSKHEYENGADHEAIEQSKEYGYTHCVGGENC